MVCYHEKSKGKNVCLELLRVPGLTVYFEAYQTKQVTLMFSFTYNNSCSVEPLAVCF